MNSRRSFLRLCACCAVAAATPAFAQSADRPHALSFEPIADGVWRHTSWRFLGDNAPFSSNGVVIAGERRVLVADTPWNADEAEPLIERVRAVAPGREIVLVVTHAHDDRMIGMPAFQAAGAETWAHVLTQADAASRGLTRAAHTWLARLKRFDLGGRVVEAFHPGAAHTRDNCVVWDETTGTLDGGCMVRPLAMGLGNTADGDLAAYPVSVARLNARYLARARIVVPGHGETDGVELLAHTQRLADRASA